MYIWRATTAPGDLDELMRDMTGFGIYLLSFVSAKTA